MWFLSVIGERCHGVGGAFERRSKFPYKGEERERERKGTDAASLHARSLLLSAFGRVWTEAKRGGETRSSGDGYDLKKKGYKAGSAFASQLRCHPRSVSVLYCICSIVDTNSSTCISWEMRPRPSSDRRRPRFSIGLDRPRFIDDRHSYSISGGI